MTNGQTLQPSTPESETPSPLVVISVLNWNGWKDTIECLKSVRELDYPNYLVVVVDNGSMNDSADRISEWVKNDLGAGFTFVEYEEEVSAHGGVEQSEQALNNAKSANRLVLIRNKENLGFTGGNNTAIRYGLARNRPAQYVFLLNNDTWLDSDCVTQMVVVHRQTGAGIVGAVVLDGERHVHFAGRATVLRQFFSPYVNWLLPAPTPEQDSWTSDTVFGTGMMVSAACLNDIHKSTGDYMDSSIYLYGDEMSLCLTARGVGYETRVARLARVYHRNGKSSGGNPNPMAAYYVHRNMIRVARRFLPLGWWILFQMVQVPTVTGRAAKRVLKGRKRVGWAIMAGLIDGYRGVGGKWKHHDEEVKRLFANRFSEAH
jgi:GT2 family glycosyltransferase